MEMTYDAFLESICHRGGFKSTGTAQEVTRGMLRVLGEVLVDSDREALAEELPQVLSESLCSREPNQDFGLETFYERIGEEEHLNPGMARETAQVVGEVLRRAVTPETINRIRRRLPDEYEEVFVNPHEDTPEPEPHLDPQAKANPRTLAEGEPGSEKPVSTAAPEEGHHESIAAQENPYEETKIATGHESTDEDDRTLAGGEPGSDRPVSDTHKEEGSRD